MIVTFIPAAGRSSRMRGRDKLLENVEGQPILRRAARTAISAGLGPVIVGLAPNDRERRKALRNLDLSIIEVPEAETGMSASLRAGAAAARSAIEEAYPTGGDYEYFGMLVLLPDMPGIVAADLQELDQAFQSSGGPCVRAVTEDGRPGHPVIFPDSSLRHFETLTGDKGAASILDDDQTCKVPLADDRATRDLDTPEDWAAWRAETNTPQ